MKSFTCKFRGTSTIDFVILILLRFFQKMHEFSENKIKVGIMDFILYNTQDGNSEIEHILDSESKTVWLTQKQMAELFDVSVPIISHHLKKIFVDQDLQEVATIRNFLIVQREGSRDIEREVSYYNLNLNLIN